MGASIFAWRCLAVVLVSAMMWCTVLQAASADDEANALATYSSCKIDYLSIPLKKYVYIYHRLAGVFIWYFPLIHL